MARSSEAGSSAQTKLDKVYYVLLVDDDPGVREITEARLTQVGFRVISAVNGLHAMQRLKGSPDPISIVITDLQMPGQNGLDLITNIKTSPEYKHIPVITLTGNLDVEVLKAAKMKGAQEVLVKPVSFSALLERIHQHI